MVAPVSRVSKESVAVPTPVSVLPQPVKSGKDGEVERVARTVIVEKPVEEELAPPPAKRKREVSPRPSVEIQTTVIEEVDPPATLSTTKMDILKKLAAWNKGMMACFDGWIWLVHRTFLNINVTSFTKEVASSDSKEKLADVLVKYRAVLLAKRLLLGGEASKKLDEGLKMVDAFTEAVGQLPHPGVEAQEEKGHKETS